MMMRLWRWLFPSVPLQGQTWRMYAAGDEVRIVRVEAKRQSFWRENVRGNGSHPANWSYIDPFVEYRTPDNLLCKAPYEQFRRLGHPVPTYIPVGA